MKQVTLNIPEKNYQFFMELIKNLDFIKTVESEASQKEKILADIKEGVREVNLIKKGKLKGISAKDLIDEL